MAKYSTEVTKISFHDTDLQQSLKSKEMEAVLEDVMTTIRNKRSGVKGMANTHLRGYRNEVMKKFEQKTHTYNTRAIGIVKRIDKNAIIKEQYYKRLDNVHDMDIRDDYYI